MKCPTISSHRKLLKGAKAKIYFPIFLSFSDILRRYCKITIKFSFFTPHMLFTFRSIILYGMLDLTPLFLTTYIQVYIHYTSTIYNIIILNIFWSTHLCPTFPQTSSQMSLVSRKPTMYVYVVKREQYSTSLMLLGDTKSAPKVQTEAL